MVLSYVRRLTNHISFEKSLILILIFHRKRVMRQSTRQSSIMEGPFPQGSNSYRALPSCDSNTEQLPKAKGRDAYIQDNYWLFR